jgi:hypothetical protein
MMGAMKNQVWKRGGLGADVEAAILETEFSGFAGSAGMDLLTRHA